MSRLDRLLGTEDPGYVSQQTAATDSCGAVTGYAADGVRILITLTVGAVETQYRLAYQFAGEAAPTDIGTRLAAHTPQLLLITGRQVPSDAASPSAIDLHDHNVARVTSCTPLSSVAPQPVGFTLPLGCAYIGRPETGADQTSWMFDCGWASRAARATLAPVLLAQGWTSCGAVTATAAWVKGGARLGVAEGAGGSNGYPRLAQFRVGIQTSCP